MATRTVSSIEPGIRKQILSVLHKRNLSENAPYADVTSAYSRLFEVVSELKHEVLQLTLQNEKLRQENVQLQCSSGTVDGKPNERVLALEQKLFGLQEELTSLHRKKGENAQQLIDLNTKLQEKERELSLKDAKLQEAEAAIVRLESENKQLEVRVSELESANVILRDEHEALQITFLSLEEKIKQLQAENRGLVDRLMNMKIRDADILNRENEIFFKQKQARMQKELEEAAKEIKVINPERYPSDVSAAALSSSVPSVAQMNFEAHEGEVNALRWSYNGRLLATGGGDRKIKLWEISSNSHLCKGTLTGSNAAVTCVEFDTSGTLMLGSSNDYATRVWNVDDYRLRHALTGHSGKVLAARFFGDMVVTGSHDRTLKVWDLRSRSCIATKFAGSSCNDLVTIDSIQIISGHFDRKIRFWDYRSETSHNEILLQGKVTSLDLSRDKFFLLACVRDDTLNTIDLRMNKIIATFGDENLKIASDWTRAAYSTSGQYAAVGSIDGAVYVFNVATNKVEKCLKEHNAPVLAVAWNPHDTALASCDKNKKVIIWTNGFL